MCHMRRFCSFLFVFLFLFTQTSQARPVSYVGGWTFIETFSDHKLATLLHYTFHRQLALGYRYAYQIDEEWTYHGPQLNVLAKRWNNPNSQANFYLHTGLGHAYSSYQGLDHENELGFISGLSLDWENRRFFTSYGNHYMNLGKIDHFFEQKARVGVAPYVAEAGALHTWIMVEVKNNEWDEEPWTVTPLVRLFKGSWMAELGYTIDGEALINFRTLF